MNKRFMIKLLIQKIFHKDVKDMIFTINKTPPHINKIILLI
jgi:hypothetical protein